MSGREGITPPPDLGSIGKGGTTPTPAPDEASTVHHAPAPQGSGTVINIYNGSTAPSEPTYIAEPKVSFLRRHPRLKFLAIASVAGLALIGARTVFGGHSSAPAPNYPTTITGGGGSRSTGPPPSAPTTTVPTSAPVLTIAVAAPTAPEQLQNGPVEMEQVTITNNGAAAAGNVTLTEEVNGKAVAIDPTLTSSGYGATVGYLGVNFGTLAAGQSITDFIVAIPVNGNIAAGTQIQAVVRGNASNLQSTQPAGCIQVAQTNSGPQIGGCGL